MKQLFTIGTTRKTAEKFFTLLTDNNVKCVLDVRRYNSSQLAGFSKYPDIKYFLKKISGIDYDKDRIFAPSEDLFNAYRNKHIDWDEYTERFKQVIERQGFIDYITYMYPDLDRYCLLCSEDKPDKCHRRLLAELIRDNFGDYEIKHLM